MKKFILIFALVVEITACKNPDPDEIAKEIAMTIKYYDKDDTNNYYKGDNEIEGWCSDYALLFALKTGANLIVQNQDKRLNIPNGVYRVTGRVSKKLEAEINDRFRNMRAGWAGPWPWLSQKKYWPLALYHPINGIYSVELIEERTVKTHFGYDMTSDKPHVWNELNGVIYDICWADAGYNIPFTGIDTYE